jgi:glycosyltransferase involved in cell wall biosynthesis
MDDSRPAVSAVLPAFNEKDNLAEAVHTLERVLDAHAGDHEIIIVDDGSQDGTAAIADSLAGPAVRVIHHPMNRGYGAALRSGFAAARFDYIFFTDSDGQFDLTELRLIVEPAVERGFAAGYRLKREDPLIRRTYGAAFSFLVRLFFGVKVRDVNCAFKLFRRSLISDFELKAQGALINAEILALARARGVDPLEVGVTHLPRQKGLNTGGSLPVILRAGREMAALILRKLRGEFKVK